MITHCQNCGLLWNSDVIKFVDSTNIILSNNFTNCPNCGVMTKLPEGHFDFDKNGFATLISNVNKDDLRLIIELAQRIDKSNGTTNDFIEGVSKINEDYASSFSELIKLSKSENFRFWLKQFFKILAFLLVGHELSNIIINIKINNTYIKPKTDSSIKNFEFELKDRDLNHSKNNKYNRDKPKSRTRRRK